MILSKKSWHYWLYKQFYWETPDNFCPYFWKVILCCIIFLPTVVLCLPALVYYLIKWEKPEEQVKDMLGIGIFSYFSIFGLVCMVLTFIVNVKHPLFPIGILCWGILAIVLILFAVTNMPSKWKNKGTMLGSYIKAKKEKHCPKITWKDEGV